MLNEDYKDMLLALSDEKVSLLVRFWGGLPVAHIAAFCDFPTAV